MKRPANYCSARVALMRPSHRSPCLSHLCPKKDNILIERVTRVVFPYLHPFSVHLHLPRPNLQKGNSISQTSHRSVYSCRQGSSFAKSTSPIILLLTRTDPRILHTHALSVPGFDLRLPSEPSAPLSSYVSTSRPGVVL